MNTSDIAVGIWLEGDQALDLDAFATACGLDAGVVRLLVEEGMLQPTVDQPAWRFGGEAVARARRIHRLQRDFEANLQSVAVMLDLIDEVDRLRARVGRIEGPACAALGAEFGSAPTPDIQKATVQSILSLGACMPIPTSALYDYIVRELAPSEHEPDEAPITIVCEPLAGSGGAGARGTLSMRLKVGTTPEEARAIASSLRARVKGFCHLEASDDEAV